MKQETDITLLMKATYRSMRYGCQYEVNPTMGQHLIEGGYAEEVKSPKAKPKPDIEPEHNSGEAETETTSPDKEEESVKPEVETASKGSPGEKATGKAQQRKPQTSKTKKKTT